MKYITNETINHFKKYIARLHKKGDETLLNRKKKREEIKQKNKLEKAKLNSMNNVNPYNNYYHGMYMPPPLQINNQNPAYYNEYQNIYYLNPQTYQIPPGMVPTYLTPQYMLPPKTLEENINAIYERGIVNNIIGAFFIKECQDKSKNQEKRKVPVSTVQLNSDIDNYNNNNNEEQNKLNNIDNNNNENANSNNLGYNMGEINYEEKKDDKEEKEEINKEQNKQNNNVPYNDNELRRPDVV